MLAAAVFCGLLAIGLGTAGRPFRPAAAGFALFAAAHLAAAFSEALVAPVLSAGLLVVMLGLVVTGVLVARGRRVRGVPAALPFLAAAWGVTVPIGIIFISDTAHALAIAVLGLFLASLGLTVTAFDEAPVAARA